MVIIFLIFFTTLKTPGSSSEKTSSESPLTSSPDMNQENDQEEGGKTALQKEIRFYKVVNKIDPVVLKALMGNMTEETRVPSTPSPHCCFNGGTCHLSSMNKAGRWCSCPSNFTGRYCDVDVDECLDPKICDEHQVCTNTYGGFKCDCQHGFVWDGYRCVGKTSCNQVSCLNFGECAENDDGHRITCICTLGYSGKRCEKKMLDCDDSSCTEDEICVAIPDGYRCINI